MGQNIRTIFASLKALSRYSHGQTEKNTKTAIRTTEDSKEKISSLLLHKRDQWKVNMTASLYFNKHYNIQAYGTADIWLHAFLMLATNM
jgi:hypothetical protein